MPGPADTYQSYGVAWANVSDTPFRLYKSYVHEGGIAAPLIVHWPASINGSGEWRTRPSHLIDIMATCAEIGQAGYPLEYQNHPIKPKQGMSLTSVFKKDKHERGQPLFWEHKGNRAVRADRWKLVQRYNHEWQLFDMEADRTETHDLSSQKPDLLTNLKGQYQQWADLVGVQPWPIHKR